MSYTVWRFEYSVQERIEALRDILVQQEKLLSSHVKREWLYRAQLVLEPAGWYALWRLPRETCQKYGIFNYYILLNIVLAERLLQYC